MASAAYALHIETTDMPFAFCNTEYVSVGLILTINSTVYVFWTKLKKMWTGLAVADTWGGDKGDRPQTYLQLIFLTRFATFVAYLSFCLPAEETTETFETDDFAERSYCR